MSATQLLRVFPYYFVWYQAYHMEHVSHLLVVFHDHAHFFCWYRIHWIYQRHINSSIDTQIYMPYKHWFLATILATDPLQTFAPFKLHIVFCHFGVELSISVTAYPRNLKCYMISPISVEHNLNSDLIAQRPINLWGAPKDCTMTNLTHMCNWWLLYPNGQDGHVICLFYVFGVPEVNGGIR